MTTTTTTNGDVHGSSSSDDDGVVVSSRDYMLARQAYHQASNHLGQSLGALLRRYKRLDDGEEVNYDVLAGKW